MGSYKPNRVMAGKRGAGRFDFKRNAESDIELYNEHEYRCESMHELVIDYMDDIEANPTIEGVCAASKKYRSEAVRFEEALKDGTAGLESYPDPDSWDLEDRNDASDRFYLPGSDLYISGLEGRSDEFCLTSALLELKAVARVNEIRNMELAEKYKEYNNGSLAEPSEIEISVRDSVTDFSGTVQKVDASFDTSLVSGEEYRSSFLMLLPIEKVALNVNGRPGHSWANAREALKNSHQTGYGAAYRLQRYEHDPVTMSGVFSEVIIEPSVREVERSKLESPAISEGWL